MLQNAERAKTCAHRFQSDRSAQMAQMWHRCHRFFSANSWCHLAIVPAIAIYCHVAMELSQAMSPWFSVTRGFGTFLYRTGAWYHRPRGTGAVLVEWWTMMLYDVFRSMIHANLITRQVFSAATDGFTFLVVLSEGHRTLSQVTSSSLYMV